MVPVRLLFTNPEHPRNLVRVWASIWALPINYGLAPVASRSLRQQRKKKEITRRCASPSPSVLRPPPLPQLRRFLSPGGAGQPCLRRHCPHFFFLLLLLSPSCSTFSRSAAAAGLAYGSPRNQDGEAVTATALGSSATMGHRRR